MMNKRNYATGKLLGEVLAAALMSAGMAMLFGEMLHLTVDPLLVYGAAAGLAAVVFMLTWSRASAWITLLTLVAAALAGFLAGWRPIARLTGLLEAVRAAEGLAEYARDLTVTALVLLYCTVYIFAHQQGSAWMLLVLLLALLGVGWFFNGVSASIHILPPLIAVSALFARGEAGNEPLKALLSLSLIAALLACALVPGEGVKSPWLERASQKTLRALMRAFNIERDNLDERRSFTIGFDGWLNRREAFGGPAYPQDGALMRVETEHTAYLRGSIRYVYDNRAWVDEDNVSKAGKIKRYMMGGIEGFVYRDEYERAFDLDKKLPESAFARETIAVEALKEGVSWSIFTPGRTEDVRAEGEVNVYYNNIGEQFISRALQPGDRYTLNVQRLTAEESELPALLEALSGREDKAYPGVLLMNRELPLGIESPLYSLTYEIISGRETPFEKACAIRDWLITNGRYTLNGRFAPGARDFVSWFVLDEREGYCTYYAAAMAVMARIAGLPARYVEGYLAVPDENGECIITGRDAHAWAEVYFENFGWMTFDATPPEGRNGDDEGSVPEENGFVGEPDPSEPDLPTPSPTPTPELDDPFSDEPEPTFPPEENEFPPEEAPQPSPSPSPELSDPGNDGGAARDEEKGNDSRFSGLAALLSGLILLVILMALFVYLRLRATQPARMAQREKDETNRLMIWYRAMLTALEAEGLHYETGDTPLSFAENAVNRQMCPQEFIAFSKAVSRSRYAESAPEDEAFRLAQRAYRGIERRMKLFPRGKWMIHRVLHGIGSIDPVP